MFNGSGKKVEKKNEGNELSLLDVTALNGRNESQSASRARVAGH